MLKEELKKIEHHLESVKNQFMQEMEILEEKYKQAVYEYAAECFDDLKEKLRNNVRSGDIETSFWGKRKVRAVSCLGGDELSDILYEIRIQFDNINLKETDLKEIKSLPYIKDPNAMVLVCLKKMCDLEGIRYRYRKIQLGYHDGYIFETSVQLHDS